MGSRRHSGVLLVQVGPPDLFFAVKRHILSLNGDAGVLLLTAPFPSGPTQR